MRLLAPKRYILLLLALSISMSLCVNSAGSVEEKEPLDASKSEQDEDIKEEKTGVVARIFRIKNLDIQEARAKVKDLLSKDEKVKANVKVFTALRAGEQVNFLLIKDTAQNISQIGRVLEKLEKEFAPTLVSLDFSDVPLNQILTSIAQMTGLNIIGAEALSDQKITIHLRDIPLEDMFDTILESTDYAYIKEDKIIRIISRDQVPLATEVFELRFVTARQIQEGVSHLLSEKGNIKSFSKFSGGKGNVLIVTDTLESLEAVRSLIKRLDKKLRQVMIEVKFCEVTLNRDTKLGVEYLIEPYIKGAITKTRFPLPMMGTKQLDRPDVLTQESGEITLGTISFEKFRATLHALDTKTEINLIATPRIATRDGEEAEILIGEKVPIPLYERNEETGTMEVTGYEIEEVGVLLKVTPVINRDNTVTLKIHPEVSKITDRAVGPSLERPIISTREVTTLFTVEDGKTVVLGGLMKEEVTNTMYKVPLLGDIPILGNLFRYKGKSEERTELFIFITPHILEETAY